MVSYIKEERRLRVFENRILRRIFGPKRDENREWRTIYNEERLPDKVRVITMGRLCSKIGRK